MAKEWPHGTWLPWSPGRKARSRLVKTLREKWGYRRVRGAKGEAVLVTDEPSEQRIVIPDHRSLDKETARGVVAAVAEHKGVERGDVLLSMLVEPKWVAKQEEREKHRTPIDDVTPPWLEPWRDE